MQVNPNVLSASNLELLLYTVCIVAKEIIYNYCIVLVYIHATAVSIIIFDVTSTYHTHAPQATSGHAWYVHEGVVSSNGTCTDTLGAQYNPYGVNTSAESGYLNGCSALNQQRCAMGDLSGKLGTLQRLEPPHNTYSFYDENLHLLGPFTSTFLRPMWQPIQYIIYP